MELSYGIHSQFPGLESNVEAFNALMGMFELSGVFSDKIQCRVYSLAWRGFDVRIKLSNKKIDLAEADEIRKSLFREFSQLLNTYSIFSQEFKTTCLGLFHTIQYY